ncbi:TfoX/Sxy family protein [Georgenia soli]
MPRPTEEDEARFRAAVPEDPRVEIRPMFGNLGAFVGGHMFAGLFGSQLGVKLPEDELVEVRAAGGGDYGPPERPMGGWITVPEGVDPAGLVARAAEYVATFPPKPTAKRR